MSYFYKFNFQEYVHIFKVIIFIHTVRPILHLKRILVLYKTIMCFFLKCDLIPSSITTHVYDDVISLVP
jgi:hypothetical protein